MSGITLRRPTRDTLAAVVFALWAVCTGVWRDFVWEDLRAGFIDLRGLSRSTRFLILIGFALLSIMVVALVLNDVLRSAFVLLARVDGSAGRGALIPFALVPVTLFLVAVAWSFALTGALHSHMLIRLGVLAVYMLEALGWTNLSGAYFSIARGLAGLSEILTLLFGLALAMFMPLFFLLRWRGRARPVFEFMVILVAVSGVLAIAQARQVQDWRQFGIPIMLGTLDTTIGSLQGLVIPLLLIIGIDMASFANQVAQWTTRIIVERLPKWVAIISFVVLLVWRLQGVIGEGIERVNKSSLIAEGIAYMGAFGVLISVAFVWITASLFSRRHRGASTSAEEISQATERVALPLIVAYSAIQLIIFLMLSGALAIPPVDLGMLVQAAMVAASGPLNALFTDPWHLSVSFASILAFLWLARRGEKAAAVYLGIFGCVEVYYWATDPGSWLGVFTWSGTEVLDFWWVTVVTLFALYWIVQRKLTAPRAAALFLILMLTALQRQTAFVGNRFSPLFGFAGVGFIAFGVAYDAVTMGTWANVETRGLPRTSRIFLYLGYVLLTVTVVNWALASHDLNGLSTLTGGAALVGMERFGRPMLYAIYAAVLAAQLRSPPQERTVAPEPLLTEPQASPPLG